MIVIGRVENNRVMKYAAFATREGADEHARKHGGFVYAGSYSPDLYVDGLSVTLVPRAPTLEEEASAREEAEVQALKSDAKFQNLVSKTPAQARAWCQSSFPTLTGPEQNDMATLVHAIGILGRRI